MPEVLKRYVRYVEALNRAVGRFAMYVLFLALMVILLYPTISGPLFGQYPIWAVEMGEFTLAAYYLLGGGYSMMLNGHVRMDVLYSRWSTRTRAIIDTATDLLLIFYLVVLLVGGISGIDYALQYNQKNYSSWAPPIAPIKIIMAIGIGLMLLQAVATLIKDIATVRGESLDGESLDEENLA